MNKNFALIATALALSLPWLGCNKSGTPSQPSTFTPPAGPIELKLKWPPGERIVQDLAMKQNMELTMPGRPAMQQDMTMGQEYSLTVLPAPPDGGHELEMEFLNARIKMVMGGKSLLDYDSADTALSDKTNPASDIFGKLVGAKIRYFLNDSNGVERLEGIEELMNRLAASAPTGALASIKNMYSEDFFKQMMSQNRYLPPKAVQPGDTWPVQFDIPMGQMGIMEMDYTFTFHGWEMHGDCNCARLEFQGALKMKPNSASNRVGMSISGLDGDSSGISWFDPDRGIIVETTMNQNVNMAMNIAMKQKQNPDAAASMQSISNRMTQVMTIKLASVK